MGNYAECCELEGFDFERAEVKANVPRINKLISTNDKYYNNFNNNSGNNNEYSNDNLTSPLSNNLSSKSNPISPIIVDNNNKINKNNNTNSNLKDNNIANNINDINIYHNDNSCINSTRGTKTYIKNIQIRRIVDSEGKVEGYQEISEDFCFEGEINEPDFDPKSYMKQNNPNLLKDRFSGDNISNIPKSEENYILTSPNNNIINHTKKVSFIPNQNNNNIDRNLNKEINNMKNENNNNYFNNPNNNIYSNNNDNNNNSKNFNANNNNSKNFNDNNNNYKNNDNSYCNNNNNNNNNNYNEDNNPINSQLMFNRNIGINNNKNNNNDLLNSNYNNMNNLANNNNNNLKSNNYSTISEMSKNNKEVFVNKDNNIYNSQNNYDVGNKNLMSSLYISENKANCNDIDNKNNIGVLDNNNLKCSKNYMNDISKYNDPEKSDNLYKSLYPDEQRKYYTGGDNISISNNLNNNGETDSNNELNVIKLSTFKEKPIIVESNNVYNSNQYLTSKNPPPSLAEPMGKTNQGKIKYYEPNMSTDIVNSNTMAKTGDFKTDSSNIISTSFQKQPVNEPQISKYKSYNPGNINSDNVNSIIDAYLAEKKDSDINIGNNDISNIYNNNDTSNISNINNNIDVNDIIKNMNNKNDNGITNDVKSYGVNLNQTVPKSPKVHSSNTASFVVEPQKNEIYSFKPDNTVPEYKHLLGTSMYFDPVEDLNERSVMIQSSLYGTNVENESTYNYNNLNESDIEKLIKELNKRNQASDDPDFDYEGWKEYYDENDNFFNYDYGRIEENQIKVKKPNDIERCYVYKGEMNDKNQRHGRGVCYNKNCIMRGNWRDDRFTGWGRISKKQGEVLIAKFFKDRADGLGIYINGKGCKYTGEFQKSKKNGKGKLETNKFIYVGMFKNNKLNGEGKIKFLEEGHEYSGIFEDNEITGYGRFKWKNGDIYDGNMKNGKMHGKGKYIHRDGQIYEGEYINGVKNGHGILIYPNGKKYEGFFKDGLPIGDGKYTKNGKMTKVTFNDQ